MTIDIRLNPQTRHVYLPVSINDEGPFDFTLDTGAVATTVTPKLLEKFSIEIYDECLIPEKYTYVKYSGPNPWELATKITESIRPFFHVSASGTNHWRLNWDITGDVRTFYSLWWVKKSLSRYTIMKIDIKIQGSQHKDTKMGDF